MTHREKERIAGAIASLESALAMSEEEARTLYRRLKEDIVANTLRNLKRITLGVEPRVNSDGL